MFKKVQIVRLKNICANEDNTFYGGCYLARWKHKTLRNFIAFVSKEFVVIPFDFPTGFSQSQQRNIWNYYLFWDKQLDFLFEVSNRFHFRECFAPWRQFDEQQHCGKAFQGDLSEMTKNLRSWIKLLFFRIFLESLINVVPYRFDNIYFKN